jgi:hypothetical protein
MVRLGVPARLKGNEHSLGGASIWLWMVALAAACGETARAAPGQRRSFGSGDCAASSFLRPNSRRRIQACMKSSLFFCWLSAFVLAPAQAAAQSAMADTSATRAPGGDEVDSAKDEARDLADRQSRCNYGETGACFGLGRTVITGVLLEMEDARLNYRSDVLARTGLSGGWGVGARVGIDLWDWIPLHVGVRHASPNDAQAYSRDLVTCRQTVGGQPMCETTPHPESTTAGGVLASVETGVEPSFRLARGLALSPGLLLGYTGAIDEYRRSINDCVNCAKVSLSVSPGSGYLAPSLRLSWFIFGLAVRYERFFGGDLKDGIAIALDIGARYKAMPKLIPADL